MGSAEDMRAVVVIWLVSAIFTLAVYGMTTLATGSSSDPTPTPIVRELPHCRCGGE